MKYYYFILQIIDAEAAYYHKRVIRARSAKTARKHAQRYAHGWHDVNRYNRQYVPENDSYLFFGTILVTVDHIEEIPKQDYEVLQRYLSW